MDDDDEMIMEKVEGVDYVIDKMDALELESGLVIESTSSQSSHQKHHPSEALQGAEDSPSTLDVGDFSKLTISE